jgi:hypothetical protein
MFTIKYLPFPDSIGESRSSLFENRELLNSPVSSTGQAPSSTE